jgi:uncharacterized membrane protein YgdD (TMEM256/DUF423 family)
MLKNKTYIPIVFTLGAVGVTAGAFGAHALKGILTQEALQSYQTGVLYLLLHLPILLFIRKDQLARSMLLAGVCLFSFSIFALSTNSIHQMNVSWLGPITPVGGVLIIAGWVKAAISWRTILDEKGAGE